MSASASPNVSMYRSMRECRALYLVEVVHAEHAARRPLTWHREVGVLKEVPEPIAVGQQARQTSTFEQATVVRLKRTPALSLVRGLGRAPISHPGYVANPAHV